MCYGSLPVDLPRVVVAHGDLISWWKVVHGREPKESRWLKWYRRGILEGLAEADGVVGPSEWVIDLLHFCYSQANPETGIYNRRTPIFFNPNRNKEESMCF